MKPLVSLILLSYNQEKYIESAVTSVLNQDYENIEIIISDDCSTDRTFKIISETVKLFPKTKDVILNKNKTNMGLTAHLNKVLQMSNGEIIVLAAGDDISFPNRVSQSVNILIRNKNVTFVSFNEETIDSDGNKLSEGKRVNFQGIRTYTLQDYIKGVKIPFSGASRAFKRSLYDCFGDLDPKCPTEDTPYILRGLILGEAAISSDIAIKYRRHAKNLSNPLSIANMDIHKISDQYLRDTNSARDMRKLPENEYINTIKWIESNRNRRNKLNNLQISDSKLTYFTRNIALSPDIKVIDKVKILKHIIRKKTS